MDGKVSLVRNALHQGFPALTTAAGENADLEKGKDIHLREIIPLCAEFPIPEWPTKLKYCKGDFLAPYFFKKHKLNLPIPQALLLTFAISPN